jgi:putative lysine transport system substrate-binding protein
MKNLRKILAAAMAAVIAFAFAACGSSSSKTTTTTKVASGVEDGVLTISNECSYAPYNWTQSDSSNGAVKIKGSKSYANGYDIMIAKKICEANGWKLEVVKSDWGSLVPAVQAGTIDCAIAGQSMTSEREKQVDFAGPYYYASIVVLCKKDNKYANAKGISDLAGGKCTSQIETIWYDSCLPQIKNANIVAAKDDAPTMIVAVESGDVDYVVTDIPTAKAACAAYSDLKMLDFTGTDDNFKVDAGEVNIGISVKKGNTVLKNKINKVLSTMTKDDMEALMDKAISIQPVSGK